MHQLQHRKPILAVFDRVIRDTGAALLYVHHDAKGSAGDRNIRDRGAGSGVLARDYDCCITLTAHRNDKNAAVINTLLRNYAPQQPFVSEFCDFNFSVSDLPAVAETSRNVRKKQDISVSDEAIIIPLQSSRQFDMDAQALNNLERLADFAGGFPVFKIRDKPGGRIGGHGQLALGQSLFFAGLANLISNFFHRHNDSFITERE